MFFGKFVEDFNVTKNVEVLALDAIEEIDTYCEPKMKLTIYGASYVEGTENQVVELFVSYENYDEHNKQFESANFYDERGIPRLTAREANYYRVKDSIFFNSDSEFEKFFKILE